MTTAPNTTNDRWTIGRLLSWTTDYFEKREIDDPRLAAEVLLAHCIGCKRIDLYARFAIEPEEAQTLQFRQLVKRAADHEPIAYLVGEKEFFSLSFHVTPDVLIPRGETETLVERVIEHCRKRELTNPVILDVGTGSGCIAIAILSQLTGATAVAADISPQALAVAKKNAVRHGLSDRITFLEADRLGLPAGAIPENGFDIIASNPPYVPTGEIETLGPNVKDYEPHEALTDGGDGLSFYETIATEAPNILGPDGIVLVEIADGQEQAVRDTFTRAKKWAHAGTWKDAVTNRERVVAFVRD